MKQVFVYGTCKRGGQHHALLAGQTFIGPGVTLPEYRMYLVHALSPYPVLIHLEDPVDYQVEGEVWEVDEESETLLDRLAGTLFVKRVVHLIQWPTLCPVSYLFTRSVAGLNEVGRVWIP